MGSGSLAGVLGHFLGGYLADSPTYGRKLTLLFSAGLSILAAVVLALTQTLPMLILVNLIVGLSSGVTGLLLMLLLLMLHLQNTVKSVCTLGFSR